MMYDLEYFSEKAINELGLPSISLAVFRNGQVYKASAGTLNLSTGVKATMDSIFQIGSITKLFTTCLVMQLVDEGKINLDTEVQHYLPDFQIANSEASSAITVKHLLNHTSGIDGDFFPDDEGHTGNLIARYVDRCSALPLVHPVGERFCYSNAAFSVAGRLVEVIRGVTWHQAIKRYIFEPLGLSHSIADPKDMIRYRTAMGHVYGEGENNREWQLPERAYWTLGQAPAGTVIAMSASDLVAFAQAHLNCDENSDDRNWLSNKSVKAMQTPTIDWPLQSQLKDNSVGLGWMISDYRQPSSRVIHHIGATMGFLSALHVLPEHNAAVAVLINGFNAAGISKISNELLQDYFGIPYVEPVPTGSHQLKDCHELVGHYESMDSIIEVSFVDQILCAQFISKLDPIPPQKYTLRHVQGDCYATHQSDGKRASNISFERNSMNQIAYIFIGVRLVPKLS